MDASVFLSLFVSSSSVFLLQASLILFGFGVVLGDAVLFSQKNGAIDLPQERRIFFILYLAFLAADFEDHKDFFRGGLQICKEAVAGGWEEQGCVRAGTPETN